MKDPNGNPAPKGGFQNGGWYSGYQYVNGTFAPQAGMIHPESSQPGAGQMVSSEVNRQSDAAQGLAPGTIDNYVQQQNNGGGTGGGGGGYGGGGGGVDGSGGGMGGAGIGYNAPAPIDLPGLNANLTKSSGISDLEAGIATKQKAYNDAQSKINDNPFLSEASRTGRVAKLTTDFNNDIKTDQDTLAMKKADVQTQLDLQTKQFDINSQAAKQGLDTFNSLLQSGALDNASGQDIANITRSTGLSSQAIQSAIKANQAKNVSTSVMQYDDGTNQGFAVINTKTGQVISKQVIAGSKPTKGSGGASANLSATEQRTVAANATKALQKVDVNKDKLVSLAEYQNALEQLVASSGVDAGTADDYLTKQMQSLGYGKWKW